MVLLNSSCGHWPNSHKNAAESSVKLQLTETVKSSSMTRNLCPHPSWHLLPVFLGLASICGMISTYTMAKRNCHVEKWILPYISYTGTEHPESSIFGLFLNTEGFVGIAIVVLAWRFMQHVDQRGCLNTLTLGSGILGCVGVIIVGNFQVSKNKVPHYVGACLTFFVGTIYCMLSSIITRKLHKSVSNRTLWSTFVCVLRFSVAGVMVVSIVSLMILAVIREKRYPSKTANTTSVPAQEFRFPNGSCVPIIEQVPVPKRYFDLSMSVLEWLLTACLLFSLSLYAYEFKHFRNVKIVLKKRGVQLSAAMLQRKHKIVKCATSPGGIFERDRSDITLLDNQTLKTNCASSVVLNGDTKTCKICDIEEVCNDNSADLSSGSKSLPDIACLDV